MRRLPPFRPLPIPAEEVLQQRHRLANRGRGRRRLGHGAVGRVVEGEAESTRGIFHGANRYPLHVPEAFCSWKVMERMGVKTMKFLFVSRYSLPLIPMMRNEVRKEYFIFRSELSKGFWKYT